MPASRFDRFVKTVAVATVVALVLSAILTPPDPVSQMRTTGVLMLIVLPLSYYLTYHGGFETISDRLDQ